ncbi:MAG: xanthine dehydrogenase family protein molybdopterin-binding subunit [Rhodospirillaceae bacterium]
MQKVEIGQPVRRREDQRFLTGKGTYIDDINLPGQAYAGVLRSPHAHARINKIDASAALSMPGVLMVVTGEDWKRAGYGPVPTRSGVNKKIDGTPLNEPPRHCIAIDRVRFVGQEVALVVAETPTLVKDAMEAINVDYEPLGAVVDAAAAVADGAPQIHDDIPGNFCVDFQLGDKEGVDKALAEADHVITLAVINNRVTAVPMEPRGAIAAYDAASESFELQNATQNVHANRGLFSENVLKIAPAKLHHVAPDVGGGFGAKNGVYGEPALLLHAARELKRPIKWVNDRAESFLSDTHGRGQSSVVTIALDADGTFRALKTETIGGIGAFCATVGPFTPTGGSARTQGGPYRFPAMHYTGKAVFTNTTLMDPYRGAGRPEASFQTERIIEYAARKLGMDPVELRRKNLLRPDELPMKTSMGLDVDSGNFPLLFEETLKMSDRAGYTARVEASAAKGCKRGFAIAPYLECTGGGPKEHTGITFNRDGTVTLATGAHSTGMGIETSMSQILAAQLGLEMADIKFVQADTDATPIGGGHGGSRNMEVGGSSVLLASEEVIAKGKRVAAETFGIDPEQVRFEDGRFFQADTNHTMTIREVIEAAVQGGGGEGGEGGNGLDTETVFTREVISVPNGCHAAEVEVDPETGKVRIDGYWVMDDFGTVINPMLADGQVMGGVAQGIGQALMENIVYDNETGQLITGSLVDYALPRADDMPSMQIGYYEGAPTKKNPLGVKGSGEAGCVGAPPAVVNAVLDALKDFGIHDLGMPLTPERVWRAIRSAGK